MSTSAVLERMDAEAVPSRARALAAAMYLMAALYAADLALAAARPRPEEALQRWLRFGVPAAAGMLALATARRASRNRAGWRVLAVSFVTVYVVWKPAAVRSLADSWRGNSGPLYSCYATGRHMAMLGAIGLAAMTFLIRGLLLQMTNEESGQALGFGLVLLASWIGGIIWFIVYLRGRRGRGQRVGPRGRG